MIERTRAWRRRKMRTTTIRLYALQVWFKDQFQKHDVKPDKEHKQHRHGALTHAQDLREHWSSQLDLRDAA